MVRHGFAVGLIDLTMIAAALHVATVCAAELGAGAKAEVRANAMWFEEAETVVRWQAAKAAGDAAALAALESELLSKREAWRFVEPQAVEVVSHEQEKRQVKVKMMGSGRMQGSEWFVDESALAK